MKTLPELNAQYQDLFDQLIEASESDTPLDALQALEEALSIDSSEFEGKAGAYCYRLRQFKAQSDFLKAEAKSLAEKAKRVDMAIERLNQNIAQALDFRGVKKLVLDHYTLSFRKSEVVEIDEPGAIPDCYIRSEIVSKIDKIGIKQALKQGEKVQGARIVEKQNLQIK